MLWGYSYPDRYRRGIILMEHRCYDCIYYHHDSGNLYRDR
jgi:hypothetical protein